MTKKLLSSLLGMVVVLAWWTIRGDPRHYESVESIPPKVWDGGGGTIAVSVNTTTAGKLLISFEEDAEDGRALTAEERVGPGTHSWSLEVPRKVGGSIEFSADAPQVGDRLSWTITHDARRIAHESITMDRPLKKNEAFFLIEDYDDFSKTRGIDEDGGDEDGDKD